MTKLINNQVIFAVDNGNELHGLAKFSRYLDTLQASMKLRLKPRACTGMWGGILENSFYMDYNDFMKYVLSTEWVKNQESFLVLNSVNPRQPHRKQAAIHWQNGNVGMLGIWERVNMEKAFSNFAFTHFDDDGTYWVADGE